MNILPSLRVYIGSPCGVFCAVDMQGADDSFQRALCMAYPKVLVAPLPSGAQFLNVIESVFSGMARAIVHNSNYASADDAKAAIDRYFAEHNG